MAKKQKVVIDSAYLEVLRERSDLLGQIFGEGEGDRVIVTQEDFKVFTKFEKALGRVDTIDEPYESAVVTGARKPKGAE